MDPSLKRRTLNVVWSDQDTESCPNCASLNIKDQTKRTLQTGNLFKTVVCCNCRQEWLPQKKLE